MVEHIRHETREKQRYEKTIGVQITAFWKKLYTQRLFIWTICTIIVVVELNEHLGLFINKNEWEFANAILDKNDDNDDNFIAND